jgi:phenylpyruvate tautomerase PptA (4-oxalocrotonate tautomerase family)
MPMIDLTLPEGALGEDAKARLVEELTTTLLRWEGAPDNERSRGIAWAYVDERPAGTVNVAGAPAPEPRYRVRVTVPEGTLDDERKAGLVSEVTERVLAAEGAPNEPEHAARVWCIIREVGDGNWGAGGRIARLKDIAEFVGATPDSVRAAKRQLVGERS